VNEDEDLDLLALQRQLDDAFATTRPRRGFEDELWLRMQSRRPFWRRLGDGVAGLTAGIREVPAVPAAAVAAVLVVLLGAGVLTLGALNHGAGSSPTSAALSQSGGKYNGLGPQSRGSFGSLPVPSLTGPGSSPTDMASADQPTTPKAATPAQNLYFGPATLTWGGQLNVAFTQAPVFRYQEPTPDFVKKFTATHQLTPQPGGAAPGYIGTFSGQGFTISLRGSSGTPTSEPFYVLTVDPSAQAPGSADPADVARKFLGSKNLSLTWPDTVSVVTSGDQVRIKFLRILASPGGTSAYLVDGSGERYGAEVDLTSGRPVRAAGPLPVSLDQADYPIISASDAVASALASGPSGSAEAPPFAQPRVQLTSAELVYALVWAGDHSFYEPCFMFSGTFDFNGTKYVKRILVPAVAPSYRSS
jgi:hypothetical protein